MTISQINSYENRNSALKNAAVASAVGLAGGAYVGRLAATPLNKDGKFDDKFVHNVMTACADDVDDVKFMDFARKVSKMPEKPTAKDIQTVQDYLLENAKPLGLLDEIVEIGGKKSVKFSLEEYIQSVKEGHKEALDDLKESLGKVYDVSKKTFKKISENADEELKELSEISKKVLGDAKNKNAWKFGGVGFVAAGAAAWLATKISDRYQ